MSIKTSWPRLLLCIAALQACGGDDDAGMDAGSSPEDASSLPDTGSLPDATTPDAGPADGGTPPDASLPEDASMPVDAGPECEPGAMRVAPCGNCGMGQEVCSEDGYWESGGTCLNEGECAPGELETESLPLCAERSRLCSASCEWGAWDETAPAGECAPGDTRNDPSDCGVSEFRDEVCSDACEWEPDGPCVDPCGGTRRTSPADAEEVCIPEGTFIRGSTLRTDTQPVSEIFISSFYIDRYPVTVRRYQECYEAGACTQRASVPDPAFVDVAPLADYVGVFVGWREAQEFCAWAGGRLPTEAEWEKAARGPAPREVRFPWGDDYPDCAAFMSPMCPGWDAHLEGLAFSTSPGRYDEFPELDSYYGVSMMLVSGREITADAYSRWFYGVSEGEPDPFHEPLASEGSRASRGVSYGDWQTIPEHEVFLFDRHRTFSGTIRCARDVR